MQTIFNFSFHTECHGCISTLDKQMNYKHGWNALHVFTNEGLFLLLKVLSSKRRGFLLKI